jgi:hypothetical protein
MLEGIIAPDFWSHNSSFYVNMFNFEKQEFSVLFEFEQLEA